jgi:hypothetical protein
MQDMLFQTTGEMSMACILVSLNVHGKLAKEMNLVNRGITHLQCLDYEGVLFHCRRCHEHDHILKYFPLPYKGSQGKQISSQSSKCLVSQLGEGSFPHSTSKDQSLVEGFISP